MLTRLLVRNFKKVREIDIELGDVVVFIGPNNSGKTSALQALWLWSAGVTDWVSQRKTGLPGQRPGVTIPRLGLTQIPVRDVKHLWRGLRILDSERSNGEKSTKPVFIDVVVEGETHGQAWTCGMEYYYANPESLYCRPIRDESQGRLPVPDQAKDVALAFLPPLSGLAPEEPELQPGRISVLLGQGRSGEVLRNLCLQVKESDPDAWEATKTAVDRMFRVRIGDPERDVARGIIELSYEEDGIIFDVSSAGRGLQQVLLLLAHMNANPGSVLLLDEPDAHLEVLRQREVYSVLSEAARRANTQLLIASHSEVVMQEAIDRDVLISFVGKPRRVDDRGSHVQRELKDIRADDYYQAERIGFVIYLEGSTDLAMLRGFAKLLSHEALELLDEPFVVYVGNQSSKASEHYFALRPACPDLKAFALFDRLERGVQERFAIPHHMWRRREIENYLSSPDVLMRFATNVQGDDLVARAEAASQSEAMRNSIQEIETAFRALRKDPWGTEIKASDEVLTPLFSNYYDRLGLQNRMRKTDFHILVDVMQPDEIDPEVTEVLDKLVAAHRGSGS